jgi:hypothetical protein
VNKRRMHGCKKESRKRTGKNIYKDKAKELAE